MQSHVNMAGYRVTIRIVLCFSPQKGEIVVKYYYYILLEPFKM